MGQFSWIAQDTGKSISSTKPRPVTLTDNEGRQWTENNYEGYGEFDGKDFYELFAEMNGRTCSEAEIKADLDKGFRDTREEAYTEVMRMKGINLWYGTSGIRHKDTGQTFLSGGIDFFNWGSDKLVDGLGANELSETGDWKSIEVREKNLKYPNLSNTEHWTYRNEAPEDCPNQGWT